VDDDALRKRVLGFLKKAKVASLATVDEAGNPHSCSIFFANDEQFRFFFVSAPDSDHSLHAARNANVAGAVYAHVRAPNRVHGIQFHGRCSPINDPDLRQHAWKHFSGKFPYVALPPLRQRFDAEQFYMVEMTWMRFTDNRKGFGWKQEVKMSETADERGSD